MGIMPGIDKGFLHDRTANLSHRVKRNLFHQGGRAGDFVLLAYGNLFNAVGVSLCSWVHDGSHHAHDDLYISITDTQVEKYTKVFKAIFEKTGHIAHYTMMMNDK